MTDLQVVSIVDVIGWKTLTFQLHWAYTIKGIGCLYYVIAVRIRMFRSRKKITTLVRTFGTITI